MPPGQWALPFTQENQPADRTVRANGLDFHYLEWGDAGNPTVLMLHGVSQQSHSWDFVSLSLSDRFHAIALDQRGHGDSDWAPDGDYSIEAQQADIDAVVEALGLGRFTLMGHSMGGRNSYVWASRHPGVLDSLVIVDTGPQGHRPEPGGFSSSSSFRTNWTVSMSLPNGSRNTPAANWSRSWARCGTAFASGPTASGPGNTTRSCAPRAPVPPAGLPSSFGNASSGSTVPRWWSGGNAATYLHQRPWNGWGRLFPDCATATVARAGHLVQGDNPADFLAEAFKLLDRVYGSGG